MSNLSEFAEHYKHALKAGLRDQRYHISCGNAAYLPVLDEILPGYTTAGERNLGIIEIPMERIVGTKTRGRTNAFASNFMPLLAVDSEFGLKWRNLCEAHLSDVGIRDPISCYEFLGRFYVQEGNKRVSVLKYFGATAVCANVIRILPGPSDAPEVAAYQDFLSHYPLTKCYEVYFSEPNSFPLLQTALGYEADHFWTVEERRRFLSSHYYFSQAFQKLGGADISASTADAMLEWLKVYPFRKIKEMSAQELLRSLETMWPKIKAIGRNNHIEFHTEDIVFEDKPFRNRRAFSMMPSYLNIAFCHELKPENSHWVRAHEEGSIYLEKTMGDQVIVQRYCGVGTGEMAEKAMEIAIKNGAEILFTTTASMITACRRVSACHPEVKIFNCSINMPYPEVFSFDSRMYESKFIAGVIAGTMSQSDDIGYIAGYPFSGVPAEINAFALGVQLARPNARIHLKWSCVDEEPEKKLLEQNVRTISSLDVPDESCIEGQCGLFRIHEDGHRELLAAPYRNWGAYYVQIARSFLSRELEASLFSRRGDYAVNYWWGMPSGAVDIRWMDQIPEGTKVLAEFLKDGIKHGTVDPFSRKIVSQDGEIRSNGMKKFSAEEILSMDWLCENVYGFIPDPDAL